MSLREFIKEYVCANTMIRLWINIDGHGRLCLFDDCKPVMSWELEDSTEYEKFRNMKVVGVTDILCDTYYEAVNIVVE
jgi:hypothetical protein